MPVPFDDVTKVDHPCTAAWLRFVEEEDGTGIRAALFESSGSGEPLTFCFTRVSRNDPSLKGPGIPRLNALSGLTLTLCRASAGSPALALGKADELPEGLFTSSIRVGAPFCRVGDDGNLHWPAGKPHQQSGLKRLLDEMLERPDPYETFERVAKALNEAFADERVQGLFSVPGLNTVVNLSYIPTVMSGQNGDQLFRSDLEQSASGFGLAARLWAVLAAPPERQRHDQDVRLEWPGELMPFQQEGVGALLSNDRLLLADDMGLGKTLQAIAAVRILRAQGKIKSCLVAAPASLLDQWRREIEKWSPELSAIIIRGSVADRSWQWAAEADVTLVSYDTLRSDFGGNAQSPVRRKVWDVVVADEAQRIKNRNDTSDALKGLQRSRSWALTGTPIENHEEELASILEFVDHDRYGQPKRYRPGVELQERHRELQLRRKKGEVLDDLPPKQVTKLVIDLHPKQRNSYDKAEKEGIVYLKSLGTEVGVQHVLELITRLKQICNADPQTGDSNKLEDIKGRVEQLTAQGHKALVFSQYTNNTSGVAAAANYLLEFNPLTLTGETPLQERAAVIDRFKTLDEHKVLVISLRAGGLGLNLQEASYVFHLDRWWNPAVERQAEDRTHRIGQTVKVNVIKYSCAGTIEERIDQILERKQDLFDQLVDDVSLNLGAQMSREELFGLFGLETPRQNR